MTCIQTSRPKEAFQQRHAAADARCIKAERAYLGAVLRHGSPGADDDENWPEAIEADRADDDRWRLEELALASGDADAIALVEQRRERDGLG